MNIRPSKDQYYLDIADAVCQRSTCLRRMYGAVIVNNDEIISTGYNGAPRGVKNCVECYRVAHNIPRGTGYNMCYSVHAEQNAIISAPRERMIGAKLYLAGRDYRTFAPIEDADCCSTCRKLIINAGIEEVIISNGDRDASTRRLKIINVRRDWINYPETLIGGY